MALPKGTQRNPLWEARRNHSFLSTMLENRKAKYAARLADDQKKVDEAAALVAELEKAETE